jgi:hypothetical protein
MSAASRARNATITTVTTPPIAHERPKRFSRRRTSGLNVATSISEKITSTSTGMIRIKR